MVFIVVLDHSDTSNIRLSFTVIINNSVLRGYQHYCHLFLKCMFNNF